jgi:hypothetical protein
MAGKTNSRHRLAQQNRWDQTMGEMTGFAVLLLDRLMHKPGLEFGDLLWMALGACASNLRLALHRGGCAAYHKSQNSQTDEAKPHYRSR